MTHYIWQEPSWPGFTWDDSVLLKKLGECRLKQGELLAKVSSLGFQYERQAQVDILIEEAITTSAIEGESLNRDSVRSSIARKLGLESAGLSVDRYADGLIDLLLDATQNHNVPLSRERLFGWHAALFPTGYSGLYKIEVAKWRSDQMRVISKNRGQEIVHYEAIPAVNVDDSMKRLFDWWDTGSEQLDGIIKASVAHFWFLCIHPFDDGNGRIARALTDMILAQDDHQPMRYYSLSSQINMDRDNYYKILEKSQKGSLDITPWITWFLDCFCRAIENSEKSIKLILDKSAFWYRHAQTKLSERHKKTINKLLAAGKGGFEGGLTNRKYAAMTKVSRATATRELQYLLEMKILVRNPGKGRSVSYDLDWE